jgi:hypothetical protein
LEPLSNSLQASIRFLIHPLPSREFGRRYLGLTGSIRPLLDSVGFTLLYRLVVCSSLDAVSSAMGIVFTRFNENRALNLPIYLLVRAYQPDLALCGVTQFKQQFTSVHHRRTPSCSITRLGYQLRILSGSAFRLFHYLLGRDQTQILSLFREGKGCETLRGVSSSY